MRPMLSLRNGALDLSRKVTWSCPELAEQAGVADKK